MVERIVSDIDSIVRIPGWQQTIAGDREVKQALRKTFLKYKLHQEQELFDRTYAYIQQYYWPGRPLYLSLIKQCAAKSHPGTVKL